MNSISKNLVLVALTLAAAGAAVAGDRAPDTRTLGEESGYIFNPLVDGTLTRAEVRAEYLRAQRDGTLAAARDGEFATGVAAAPVQPRDRADVRAEAREAAHNRVSDEI
ncbi:MAG: DUF4148 domain-containing protein [Burkholderiaceae bacterium]|nr:DUF4148 domain-containing protein [Burkholderiaceae bacterium]MDZ4146388.1 DUF4148 domain-containing protein [Burkholderiales bacterium]